MPKINVLIFPAGEINSIELHDALSTCVNVEAFGASSIDRHGEYVFKNYISGVPLISESDFFEEFNKIIDKYKIDVVFPTHDTVAEFFSENTNKIKAKIVCADKNTSEICRDKKKTYEFFQNESFCPKTYCDFNILPVFIKPKKGQGSVGAKLVNTKEDIPNNINIDDYVICEYLSGEEYTVDCLTDKKGCLRVISPRSRKRLMAGVTTAGSCENLTFDIEQIANIINNKLKFFGLWWFQIKKDKNNNWKLLEISTRCAGTMALTRAKGINLPLLSVYTAMGYDIQVSPNGYNVTMDSTLIRRYKINYNYNTVYFDFDDTLIINDKVHLPSIRFLYQCKNENKKVILITKHEKDLCKTLQNFAISKNLFDKIIHIKPEDEKADFINSKDAIFIDNAYIERKKVQDKYNIPVFDVEGIEVLLDWRI